MAVLPTAGLFWEKLILPAWGFIGLLVAIHFGAARTYARHLAARARAELRAGRERRARRLILEIDAGCFGTTAYRFLPQDLRDRFAGRPSPARQEPHPL